jgi:hypothetical protein
MNVEIIIPKSWGMRAKYRLKESVSVGGFTIPKGFVTDGVTLPQWFLVTLILLTGVAVELELMGAVWFLLFSLLMCVFTPIIGRSLPAALLHDYLLKTGLVPRRTADTIFLSELIRQGIPYWVSYLYFGLVFINSTLKKNTAV